MTSVPKADAQDDGDQLFAVYDYVKSTKILLTIAPIFLGNDKPFTV